MKENILGVLSYPYPSKLVVIVDRGNGRFVPYRRIYTAEYSNPKLATSLSKHFSELNRLLQIKITEARIKEHNAKVNTRN